MRLSENCEIVSIIGMIIMLMTMMTQEKDSSVEPRSDVEWTRKHRWQCEWKCYHYQWHTPATTPIFMIMIMIMTIMTIRTKLFLLNRDTAMVPLLVSAPVQLYRYWPRHINNVNVIISIMIIIFTITELISFRRSARTHPALFLM